MPTNRPTKPLAVALILAIAILTNAGLAETPKPIRIDRELPTPAMRAVDDLADALREKGIDASETPIVVGITGQSDAIDVLLKKHALAVPEPAESLAIAKRDKQIIVAGRDARGLAYAIYEVAQAIRRATAEGDALAGVRDAMESPHLRVRSIQRQVFNQDTEREWYESEEYWRWFFRMLARNRFNAYTLTFGHNTNYMIPPYAWMFEVPGYPDVRVKGMTDQQRAANLRNFQMIAATAQEFGIDLNVGLWTQLPVVNERVGLDFGESYVENLPEGMAGGDYCANGLRKLLQLCPGVTGVQLRMNLESGIPHDKQQEYYRAQFDAIATCGRPVKLDLRYKSLSQQTIDIAKGMGLDVNVSTKYWCEHMGLPFHPAAQDPAHSASRYGYGTMLHHPRNYTVTYRLWSVGTSRLLLWGDPDYAARFARSCTLGGGEGFEVFGPLANKGYGNEPGAWSIFADKSLRHYQWEDQRYWPWFLTFGRYGYNPDTSADVWRRELVGRFGDAGPDLDTAYRAASQVLPLITASTQFSAGSWRLWPEMLPCMHLDAYRASPPGDYSRFYAIAPFSTRKHWRAEGWAANHSAFVEDTINGNLNSKTTPLKVAAMLDTLADRTLAAVDAAHAAHASPDADAEFRATELDLRILAHIARYHAAKKRAATDLEFFRITQDRARLPLVWRSINDAQSQWEHIVELTDGVYHDNLVLGFSSRHHSDFPDRLQIHTGHWKDRLDEVRADTKFVEQLLTANGIDPNASASDANIKRYPGEGAALERPVIVHDPLHSARPDQPLTITARVTSKHPLRDVSVYYRPMAQTLAWQRITMTAQPDGTYTATIPSEGIDRRYDLLYYLEARVDDGGAFWPDWRTDDPYIVVKIER